MDHARWPVVSGPLAPYVDGFVERLVELGYAGRSVETHLYLMARLSRWLDATGLVERQRGVCANPGEQPLSNRLHDADGRGHE